MALSTLARSSWFCLKCDTEELNQPSPGPRLRRLRMRNSTSETWRPAAFGDGRPLVDDWLSTVDTPSRSRLLDDMLLARDRDVRDGAAAMLRDPA